MSARYPHRVTVTTKKSTEDAAGAAVIVDDQVIENFPCRIKQVNSEEIDANGTHKVRTTFRLYAQDWPGGVKTTVTWNGRELAQEGETLVRSSYFKADDIAVLRALDAPIR